MFHRARRIYSSEYINCVIKNIYDIAINLKYPKNILDCALARARNVTENNFSSNNLLALLYHDIFPNIPQVLKTFSVNASFKNNCTVNNKLIKNSPQYNEGYIYTIFCKNCNRFYIGQTGKTLEQRKKQHKYSGRTGQQSNALFIHVRATNHSIDWENCKKVKTSKSSVERNIIESSLIKHTCENNLYLSEGFIKLDIYITGKISKNVISL